MNRKRRVFRGALACWALWAGWTVSPHAMAAVDHVQVIDRKPYEDGRAFPGGGAYEVIRGRAWFTLDPQQESNARIVDLKLAPRNQRGLVEFSTDFVLVRPVHAQDSTLLYDVVNRGGSVTAMLNYAVDPTQKPPFMDTGFLQRNGFTILTSAWQWDVTPESGDDQALVFHPPVATDHGRPITGKVANEFMVQKSSDVASFVGIDGRAYPAAVADDPSAVLTVRERPDDRRVAIDRAHWSFVSATGNQPPNSVRLKGGFKPGRIYELTYVARDPFVVGTGLAGIRDLLSWFRTHAFEGQPAPKRVLLYGVSQTSRLIQQMLYQGFDVDEQGKLVFDGALALVGGSGRGGFNYRFGFPTRAASLVADRDYPTDIFPFTTATAHDSASGKYDSLLANARASDGRSPKLFLINKSTEFWGRAASLLQTTPDGVADIQPSPGARLYLLTGMQHLLTPDLTRGNTLRCSSPIDDRPTLRALLLDLDHWVRNDTAPPADAYPTVADGTLITVKRYASLFPHMAGVTPPVAAFVPRHLDFGDRFASEGVADRLPPTAGKPYATLVPAPDPDGTDAAGIRPVEVAVPLGTYTGWNPRSASTGFGWALDRFEGSFLPFARTEDERQSAHDPRPSLAARYASRADFISKTRAAADRAVAARLLLAEDEDRVVNAQGVLYDRTLTLAPGDTSCGYMWPIPFN